MDQEINKLRLAIIGEIFLALGFSKTGKAFQRFGWVFNKPAERISNIAVTADRMIGTDNFHSAARWMLSHFCEDVVTHKATDVPTTGPLLVISNHAGTYDTFVLAAEVQRNDLNLIASDVPFLKNLPNANSHCFFLSEVTQDRMTAARAGIRHLQNNGALLLYGTGLIDPDPAVFKGAEEWIGKWLPSIDLFLHSVPNTQVILSIVSGVVSPKWAHHPITWLKRNEWQKRRLAEFAQIIQQLIRPGSLMLTPRVSFSAPFGVKDLQTETQSKKYLAAIVARGKTLLQQHLSFFYGGQHE